MPENLVELQPDRYRRGLAWLQRRPLRWALLFSLGAISSFAFAPTFYLPVLLVTMPVFVWMFMRTAGPGAAFWDGWAFGFGFFSLGLRWIVQSFANQPSVPDAMGPPAVLLLALAMGLYPALVAAFTRRVSVPGLTAMMVFALAWAVAEWLRGHLFTGFPWNPVAAIWAVWTPMMQPLSLVGTYGLGFFTLLIAISPLALHPAYGGGGARGWIWPACAVLGLMIWGSYGLMRMNQTPLVRVPDVTVRLVQANIPQKLKWDRSLRRDHFSDHLYLSDSLPDPDGRLIVLWPETAITDPFFDQKPGGRAIISRMLPPDGVLITGLLRAETGLDGRPKAMNSVMAFDSFGQTLGQYDKHHLVPFGEYLPARSVLSALGLEKLAGGLYDLGSGSGPSTLQFAGLPSFSPLVCYEAIFPGAVVAPMERPEMLVNLTNDAWFGLSIGLSTFCAKPDAGR
ncbi:apolipoprotein N-acyltransferase [Iodidimonas gelatinilytica]|uniref:Apolipoprotein N-acyltransferase n=1 Tax=Iodidimonas gelatinilytica TaxID=1236966 RepID=A0A5A7MR44_9PROT|nr:apolipoprotein N-acyltransferase [Iodidimonas gelatinilytica]GEQ97428.1 apolipoprotein N-acyltransferase [Iodidimonas gelatinilytica]